MAKKEKKKGMWKVVLIGVAAFLFVFALIMAFGGGDNSSTSSSSTTTSAESETTKAPETTAADTATLGEKNALRKAEDYIRYDAFSKKGLIEQLEYNKFTEEEATYAVENIDVDWNEQAAKKAEQYLKYSSFSKDGLIEQLEYNGFTHEQAVYGAEQAGF